jgi:phosphatidylinositol alpha 1,6-mannosyltransferase
MRVAIVSESFLPSINGVTNSVLRVMEYLQSQGHQALVIVPELAGTPTEYAGHRIRTIPSLDLQSVLPVGMPLGLPHKKLEHLLDGFAPDVIHLASPLALGAYTTKIAKKLGIPTLSVYQTDLAGFAKHYGMSAAHSAIRKMVSKIHSRTDRTLAPSNPARRELSELGVSNVHLWRRGVNAELFHPSKKSASLRNQWDVSGEKLIIGYVGRLANEKRIHDLRVLDQNPRIQLVITGDGPAREKLASTLPHAIFLGYKSGENLAEIYASLDLFIHPGPHETFCQTVQEALSSGTPCIVPVTGGPSDLVSHGPTGYVINSHRPEELEAATLHFMLRTDKKEMREMARASVEERTWPAINAQLIKHYDDIIAEAKKSKTGDAA